MTIAQIEEMVAGIAGEDQGVWRMLEKDGRVGVRRLAVRHRRALQRQEAERQRQERMLQFEKRFWGRGIEQIAGVDEAGRGCLAGPVVAAAVILPHEVDIPGLNDSKKLSPEKRERLFAEIREKALACGVGQIEAEEIDRINILQAALKGMRLALDRLETQPQQVFIDGDRRAGSRFPETTIVDGDARSLSIAAASVVAKVHRDRLMIEYDARYPGYGFAEHKGYGSAAHIHALNEKGPCPLHRRTFGPVAELVGEAPSPTYTTFVEGLKACRSAGELEHFGRFIHEGADEVTSPELEDLRRLYRERLHALQSVGHRGEQLAADFLKEKGYALIERNYRGGGGEVDLIVERDGELGFVEVKTSSQEIFGAPEERVDRDKRRHLVQAAKQYLQRQGGGATTCRFDVVAVMLGVEPPEIVHIEDAFRA